MRQPTMHHWHYIPEAIINMREQPLSSCSWQRVCPAADAHLLGLSVLPGGVAPGCVALASLSQGRVTFRCEVDRGS